MRTHTVHIALSRVGEAQVLIGAGLTAKSAKAQASNSIHPLVQVVTARVQAATTPRSIYAVMAREETEIVFDRVSLTEPELAPGESVKTLTL